MIEPAPTKATLSKPRLRGLRRSLRRAAISAVLRALYPPVTPYVNRDAWEDGKWTWEGPYVEEIARDEAHKIIRAIRMLRD